MRTQADKFAQSNNAGPPARLGQRFSKTAFLPEAGNTIVCHLDIQDPAHTHILDARRAMMALPGAEQFLMTPEDSLHMTVSEGVIDTRRSADGWPPEVDRDAPVAEVTALYLDRLHAFAPPASFKMRVSGIYPMGLLLGTVADADKSALGLWRSRIAEVLGFRHDEHETYVHHITFGYATGWLSDAEVAAWDAGLQSILGNLTDARGHVPLRSPAFCAFSDMTHFEELRVLSN